MEQNDKLIPAYSKYCDIYYDIPTEDQLKQFKIKSRNIDSMYVQLTVFSIPHA